MKPETNWEEEEVMLLDNSQYRMAGESESKEPTRSKPSLSCPQRRSFYQWQLLANRRKSQRQRLLRRR